MPSNFNGIILRAFQIEALKKVVFSRPVSKDSVSKISGRLCAHRGKRILAVEYSLPDNTVSQRNVKEDELLDFLNKISDEYKQINLITALGDSERKISSDGKEVLLGADKLWRKLDGSAPAFESAIEALDKKKSYVFNGNEPFFISLRISDKNGRIHDKKQGKFRQICRFADHVADIYKKLPESGVITVYDLCCGKSYLGFAVYHYLTAIKGRRVNMLGVDIKGDTVRRCEALARELHFDGMKFITDDIRNLPKDVSPDLVLSLHACDVATDIVLDSAAALGASVILSTPCCHRYLNDKINSEELKFVSDFPHLRNKLCEVLTDAIRLARLKASGYKVSALELTDPDDTPKNTLIRATKYAYTDKELSLARAEYEKILDFVLGDEKASYLSEICK